VLIIVIGVWPKPFLERMEPSITSVIERVQQSATDDAQATGG
jgi:NADH:ubiquinone oxidoreductase subunit 4 (subunit M)